MNKLLRNLKKLLILYSTDEMVKELENCNTVKEIDDFLQNSKDKINNKILEEMNKQLYSWIFNSASLKNYSYTEKGTIIGCVYNDDTFPDGVVCGDFKSHGQVYI